MLFMLGAKGLKNAKITKREFMRAQRKIEKVIPIQLIGTSVVDLHALKKSDKYHMEQAL